VLQHYLAKEETQKAAHWCFVRATQSNCCSALDFLSPVPCPQKPQAEDSGNALLQLVKNATAVFPVLLGSAEAQVI